MGAMRHSHNLSTPDGNDSLNSAPSIVVPDTLGRLSPWDVPGLCRARRIDGVVSFLTLLGTSSSGVRYLSMYEERGWTKIKSSVLWEDED